MSWDDEIAQMGADLASTYGTTITLLAPPAGGWAADPDTGLEAGPSATYAGLAADISETQRPSIGAGGGTVRPKQRTFSMLLSQLTTAGAPAGTVPDASWRLTDADGDSWTIHAVQEDSSGTLIDMECSRHG